MNSLYGVSLGIDMQVYFHALCAIANSDGKLAAEEKKLILDQAQLFNFPEEKLDFSIRYIDYDEINKSSASTKKIILRDMLQLSLVDADFSNAEQSALEKFCLMTSLDKDLIGQVHAWLVRYNTLMDEAIELFA